MVRKRIGEYPWSEVGEPTGEIKNYGVGKKYLRSRYSGSERYFVAIDGEGITHPGNEVQSYCVIGGSDGKKHLTVTARDIDTGTALEFLLNLSEQFPSGEFVAFAFNYDVSMILRDMTRGQLKTLKEKPWVSYRKYRLQWRPGKWFSISDKKRHIKIYDVFSFFACKFTKAIDQYIPGSPELSFLEDMKARRGDSEWQYDEIENITEYMLQELTCMVRMMDTLKGLLATVDIKPSGWHGPGAVAGALLAQNKVNQYRKDISPNIERVTQYAYYGGRFEAMHCGLYREQVWQYDIRSAYPYALTQLPSITGEMEITDWPDSTPVPPFSLCEVWVWNKIGDQTGINPIPLRSGTSIFYPPSVKTWIWGVEYNAALNSPNHNVQVERVIRFEDNGERPFSFVGDLYNQRAQWKREKNPAQLAAKLGMNSIYGKLAQRIGWREDTCMPPTHHSLLWAGYVTATCRAMIQEAINISPGTVIATETDAIFSSIELPTLSISDRLGEWDREIYENGIMYVQSGVYFTPDGKGGWNKAKTRGFTSGPNDADEVMKTLPTLTPIPKKVLRFHGITGPLNDDLRKWLEHDVAYIWGGSGKRMHIPSLCPACRGETDNPDWHRTAFMIPDNTMSDPHFLPWVAARQAKEVLS